jgi:hypothetical protein
MNPAQIGNCTEEARNRKLEVCQKIDGFAARVGAIDAKARWIRHFLRDGFIVHGTHGWWFGGVTGIPRSNAGRQSPERRSEQA